MPAEAPLLHRALLRWLLWPLLALLFVDAAVTWSVANRMARDAHDRALQEIARDIGLQVRVDAQGTVTLDLPDAARRVLLDDPQDRLSFEVLNHTGARVAGEAIPAAADALATVRRSDPAGSSTLYDAQVDGEAVRVVERRLAGVGDAMVRVAETRAKRDALAREILLSVLLPQALLIALVALLVRFGIARGLRPLDDLRRVMAERSHKDRRPLDEASVPGELRPLVQSMNRLLQRLDEVLTLQSRFIADAAHQLKTPVAGLKAQTELLVRTPDLPDQRRVIAHLYVGLERMSRLVSQLLSLARNEPEGAMSSFQALDLDRLVLDTAMAWVPQALKRGIDLGFEGTDRPVMVTGDPVRLRELFDNLIDTAIRYSQENGRVTVRVSDGEFPRVAVSDDGPVIPLAERERIFERCHR
ncbi:MAG: sensor histidine kinase N-terminal domain-containing protein, partial [Burkholderiaceae bacterium]